MKKSLLYYSLTVLSIIALGSWVLYPIGSPGGKTGSPGDGGANCTQCHIGTPQQAIGWITTNIPVDGYTPGATYTITATGTHSGVNLFGFEVTSEDGSAAKTGQIIVTDAVQTQLANDNTSITHTINGNSPSGDSKTWTFDWIAPDQGTGEITFYGAFNAANANGEPTGDVIYLTETLIMEKTNLGIDEDIVNETELKIFPNPATDFADISWDANLYSLSEMMIYNLTGSQVGAYFIPEQQNGKFRVDLSSSLPGMYFVVASFSDGKQATVSLVKR